MSLFCVDSRLLLPSLWVSTGVSPAVAPSRVLGRRGSMLSPALRAGLLSVFSLFSFDLMALPSRALRSPSGVRLPFFSRDPLPSSSGTDVFARRPPAGRLCAFPPFPLVVPLVRLLLEWWGVEVVLVLPEFGGPPEWASLLRPCVRDAVVLCPAGLVGSLYVPTSSGFAGSLLPLFGLTVSYQDSSFPFYLLQH